MSPERQQPNKPREALSEILDLAKESKGKLCSTHLDLIHGSLKFCWATLCNSDEEAEMVEGPLETAATPGRPFGVRFSEISNYSSFNEDNSQVGYLERATSKNNHFVAAFESEEGGPDLVAFDFKSWNILTAPPRKRGTYSVEQLIAEIHDAFRDVRLEDGITVEESMAMDDYNYDYERLKDRTSDTDSAWQDLPDEVIERCYCPFSYFDVRGFRYYLPAYMCWTLKNPDHPWSHTPQWIIYALILDGVLKNTLKEHFDSLSEEQRRAVCRFLRHIESISDPVDAMDPREALDKYWGPFG